MKDQSLLRLTQCAYQVAQRAMPSFRSKFSKKTFTQPQLLACLILKTYLRLTYRGAEAWLQATDRVSRILGLKLPPDHSTLCWFFHHKLTLGLLQRLLRQSLRVGPHWPQAGVVALDSTGFWAGHSSRYYRWRCHHERGQRGWPKWAIAVAVRPQLICAQLCRAGPCGDFADLPPLATAAHRLVRMRCVLADAGYDSESNHCFCRQTLKVRSIIPARGHRPGSASTRYRQQMQRRFPRRIYRQRWKVETVISVVKRKWGDAVSARTEARQFRELWLMGVTYNLHRGAVKLLFIIVIPTVRPPPSGKDFNRARPPNKTGCGMI